MTIAHIHEPNEPAAEQILFVGNKSILKQFKIGQNVIIHPQPAEFGNKKYGHLIGFALNPVGEVILRIELATNGIPEVKMYHPSSASNFIEKID